MVDFGYNGEIFEKLTERFKIIYLFAPSFFERRYTDISINRS